MQARTALVDDAVLSAVAAGVTQVVVIGAGYDDRALRFRTPGVRFFEVDHPATQADKRRRVERLGATGDVSFVPVDLTSDDLGSALEAAGHDATAATLFVGEGLMVYLEREVILQSARASCVNARPQAVGWWRAWRSTPTGSTRLGRSRSPTVGVRTRRPSRGGPSCPGPRICELLADSGWLTNQETDIPSAGGRGVTLLVEAEPADVNARRRSDDLVTLELDDYLWYVDQALDSMLAIVSELGDELVNERPDLPGPTRRTRSSPTAAV